MLFIIPALLVGAIITSALTAPVLMIVARLVANREPTFGEAFKAMFITAIANVVAGFALGLILINTGPSPAITATAIGVSFVVLTIVLAYQLELGIGRAAITAAVLNIVLAVLQHLLGLALGAISGGVTPE